MLRGLRLVDAQAMVAYWREQRAMALAARDGPGAAQCARFATLAYAEAEHVATVSVANRLASGRLPA